MAGLHQTVEAPHAGPTAPRERPGSEPNALLRWPSGRDSWRRRAMARAAERFGVHYAIHWGNLSRLTNMLILLNISMFFLTGLVTRQNYFYTFFSLLALGCVNVGLLLPAGLLHRLWYYLIFIVLEGIGTYFLVASAWYWVVSNRTSSLLY